MNKWNITVVVLFVFAGCALFKRTEKATDQRHLSQSSLSKLTTLDESSRLTHATTMRYQKDSGQWAYSVQLWPKGKFTFLPDGGFSGEFDSVRLQGNHKINSLLVDSSAIGIVQKRHSTSKSINQSTLAAAQKITTKKSSPDIRIIFLCSIFLSIVLIFCVFAYRKHKS